MGHLNRQGHHEQIRSISKWIAVLKSRPICPQNRIHHQENPRRIANRLSLDAQVLQVRNRRLYRRRPVLLIKARTPRLRIVVFIRRPTFLHNGRLLYGNKAVEKEHRSLLIGRNAPRQRQVRRPGAFQGNRKEPPPKTLMGRVNLPKLNRVKTRPNDAGASPGYLAFLASHGLAKIRKDQDRAMSWISLLKCLRQMNLLSPSRFQRLMLSRRPMQELLLDILIGAGPSVGSTQGPPVTVQYKAKTGNRKVKRDKTAPPPGNGRVVRNWRQRGPTKDLPN